MAQEAFDEKLVAPIYSPYTWPHGHNELNDELIAPVRHCDFRILPGQGIVKCREANVQTFAHLTVLRAQAYGNHGHTNINLVSSNSMYTCIEPQLLYI